MYSAMHSGGVSFAAVPSILLFATASCSAPPDVREHFQTQMEATNLPSDVQCYRARDGSVVVLACELARAPDWLLGFRRGWWLPDYERAFRSRIALFHSRTAWPAPWRSSPGPEFNASPVPESSFIWPHNDSVHDVGGWDLYQSGQRLALLLVVIDGHLACSYSQSNAASIDDVQASLDRFLGLSVHSLEGGRASYPCALPLSGQPDLVARSPCLR